MLTHIHKHTHTHTHTHTHLLAGEQTNRSQRNSDSEK
jgi:hypothetical protein